MGYCIRAIAAALILCGSFAVNAYAETQQQVAPPQDQDAVFVTIFGDESDAHYRSLTRAVRESGTVQAMLQGSHYAEVPTSSAMYRTRYAGSTPDLPCVRIQKADGSVILQTSGENAPRTAEELVKTMQRCPRGICPWNSSIKHRKPEPAVTPEAAPEEAINFVGPQADVDVVADVEPEDEGPGPVAVGAAFTGVILAGGAAGAYVKYRKQS